MYLRILISTFVILFFSNGILSQEITHEDLKSILQSHIKVEDWLNSLRESSIKFKDEIGDNDVVLLISIDTLFSGGKSIPQTSPPFFIVSKKEGVIHFEESERKENFIYLGTILSSSSELIFFVHRSSIGGFIQYYIVDKRKGVFCKTEKLYENHRLDYFSFNLSLGEYNYFFGSTEDRKVGSLIGI